DSTLRDPDRDPADGGRFAVVDEEVSRLEDRLRRRGLGGARSGSGPQGGFDHSHSFFVYRLRSAIATPFSVSRTARRTRLAAAARAWNAGCGREIQLKIWIGSTVNESVNRSGTKGTNATAPTRSSGAASPTARESARIVPVRIPGSASGRTWPRTVCHRVAPSAYAPDRIEFGTARIASWDAMMMTGRIRSVSVNAPEITLRPSARARTKSASPRIP